MLNKENKKLIKSLHGPYYKFARELSSAVLSHNRDKDAINETLNDMFSLLANAQAENRDFSDVISDAEKTIHETVACLPIKRLRHIKLIIIILCAATAVACTCAALSLWYNSLTPTPSLGNIYDISYDNNNLLFKWNSVSNAQEYELYLNSKYIATTEDTSYQLDLDEGTYDVKIIARSEGKFENNPNEFKQIVNVEYPFVTCGIFDLNQSILLNQQCKKFKIIFTPEFNIYGTMSCTEKINSVNGVEIDQIDNNAEYWFWANTKYNIIIESLDSFNLDYFSLNICNVKDFPDSDRASIRKGITLCTTLDGTDGYNSFTSKNIDLKFKSCSYDELQAFIATPSQLYWYNSFCTYGRPYVLIKNENSSAVTLDLVPNVITVLPEGETLDLKAGYITFELPENTEFSKLTLFTIFSESYRIEFISERWKRIDDDDDIIPFKICDGNLFSRYYRGGSQVTLHFEYDNIVRYQCFDTEIEDNVIDLTNKTTITIKQGVNYIESDNYYTLIRLQEGGPNSLNKLYNIIYGYSTPIPYETVIKGKYYLFNFSETEYVFTVQQLSTKPTEG